MKSILNATTVYAVEKTTGFAYTYETLKKAYRFPRVKLNTDESELRYLLDKLEKLEEMAVMSDTWRDVTQTWLSMFQLIPQMRPGSLRCKSLYLQN